MLLPLQQHNNNITIDKNANQPDIDKNNRTVNFVYYLKHTLFIWLLCAQQFLTCLPKRYFIKHTWHGQDDYKQLWQNVYVLDWWLTKYRHCKYILCKYISGLINQWHHYDIINQTLFYCSSELAQTGTRSELCKIKFDQTFLCAQTDSFITEKNNDDWRYRHIKCWIV
jgi:hypothetical protein